MPHAIGAGVASVIIWFRILQLFSFFETLPTNYGFGRGLVIDKNSVVLHHANERKAYIQANHREICKYSDKNDSNYLTVRNVLASVVDGFGCRTCPSQSNLDTEQLSFLDDLLDVTDAIEDDFIAVDSRRMIGSC